MLVSPPNTYHAMSSYDILLLDAPASALLSVDGKSRRLFINITQEGKSAIDDLRELRYINGLKLSSEDFQPVTAYQVAAKSLDFIERFPAELKKSIDEIYHGPAPFHKELIEASFDGENFVISTTGGYKRISTATDTEDVSYVSSPYIPSSLRKSDAALTSNSHRANESALGESTIRDELSEAIHLVNVRVCVGEWVPFGPNQIVSLNERLGSLDRCQGGLFTSMIDKDPTNTQLKLPTGLTQVSILDFDIIECMNFEAEIHFPEEEGIVQVENFGMHLNVNGAIYYSLFVEAILDRKADDISLDLLSRLLVDVHQDSSKILNDLLSSYQRSLLDMIFSNDAENRGKYNMILAESIDPLLSAEHYMDRGDFENELKQIVGDIYAVHLLEGTDLLVQGRDGIMFVGPNSFKSEALIVTYTSILVREVFTRNFFVRTFVLDDLLKRTRVLIMEHERDPQSVFKIRELLNEASKDIILLQQLLSYLSESVENMVEPERPVSAVGAGLFDILKLSQLMKDTATRVRDMKKLTEGAALELNNLSQMTDVINTKQLEDVFRSVEANTKFLVDASAANERACASLEIMQVVLAGSFAFDIIDRLGGGTLNVEPPEWLNTYITVPLIESVPFLWFGLNILFLIIFCWVLIRVMRWSEYRASGVLMIRVKVNCSINLPALDTFLATKPIELTDSISEPEIDIKKVIWAEKDHNLWMGSAPKIELLYDERHYFLLSVFMQVDKKRMKISQDSLLRMFYRELLAHSVIIEIPESKKDQEDSKLSH